MCTIASKSGGVNVVSSQIYPLLRLVDPTPFQLSWGVDTLTSGVSAIVGGWSIGRCSFLCSFAFFDKMVGASKKTLFCGTYC